jgi:hypothetical protein
MRLYRTKAFNETDATTRYVWTGTQADAKAATKLEQENDPTATVKWEEIEVPTDKPGLLAWLNANCSGNG